MAYLISSLLPSHINLAPFARLTLQDRLRVHGLAEEAAFTHFLDGQLIDSMQTTSRYVSYLMAATALDIYHEGAYYVEGGLYRVAETLAESVQENGGLLKKNRRIMSIKKTAAGPLLTTVGMNTTQSTLYLMEPFSSSPVS